ncbi:MAG: hypothetical protein CME62_14695 [Halobacteriovoraceae bacterium]|nr:hypothetical protein [Halobacteriovoraceae bacterium]|tara:strand:- start:7506 stop:8144 length:639 start_codon:yes stop_codon:yes gene_type:complete
MFKYLDNYKEIIPFLLIGITFVLTFFYSQIFIEIDFDGYYGKEIKGQAYNFKLKDARGEEKKLTDFDKDYVLLTFGFTKCDGVCPLNLYRFKQIAEKIKKEKLAELKFIFISFDSYRDDADAMENFLEYFNSKNMYGLIDGEDKGIDVAKKYQTFVNVDPEKLKKDPQMQIDHNGYLYLISPGEKLEILYMQNELDISKFIEDFTKISNDIG